MHSCFCGEPFIGLYGNDWPSTLAYVFTHPKTLVASRIWDVTLPQRPIPLEIIPVARLASWRVGGRRSASVNNRAEYSLPETRETKRDGEKWIRQEREQRKQRGKGRKEGIGGKVRDPVHRDTPSSSSSSSTTTSSTYIHTYPITSFITI